MKKYFIIYTAYRALKEVLQTSPTCSNPHELGTAYLTIMTTEAVGGHGKRVAFECLSDTYCLCMNYAFPLNLMAHHKQQYGLDQPMDWHIYIVNGVNEESGLATHYPTPTLRQTPSASCESPYLPPSYSFTNNQMPSHKHSATVPLMLFGRILIMAPWTSCSHTRGNIGHKCL